MRGAATDRQLTDAYGAGLPVEGKVEREVKGFLASGRHVLGAFDDGIGLESARSTFGVVMVLDLDNLKTVNDLHGHAAGDDLLAHVAAVLRAHVRPLDQLYRWGGDEFLLIMPHARRVIAEQRIAETLTNAPLAKIGDGEASVAVHISVGVSDYASGADLEAAIEKADALMYMQKRQRKGIPAEQAVLAPPAPRQVTTRIV